ncbi:MAG: acyloxyacyl hydrolase [Chlamydiota bacterium]
MKRISSLFFLVWFLPAKVYAVVSSLYFAAGSFGILQSESSPWLFSIRYQPAKVWHTIRPEMGIMYTTKQQIFLHAGFVFDWVLSGFIVFSPHFSAGWYKRGKGKDLGFPLEFCSGLRLGYILGKNSQIGIDFFHLSNASLGSTNPGSESLALFFSKNI